MSEKTAVHEPSSHEIEPALGNEISSRLESEKSWFAITTKKGFNFCLLRNCVLFDAQEFEI